MQDNATIQKQYYQHRSIYDREEMFSLHRCCESINRKNTNLCGTRVGTFCRHVAYHTTLVLYYLRIEIICEGCEVSIEKVNLIRFETETIHCTF